MCVHNDIVRATDAGFVSIFVLLNLSAAFDTVDHGILMNVLRERFGIEQREQEWFESYHTDRTQIFKTPTSASSTVKLACSVPLMMYVNYQYFQGQQISGKI